eukprot:TRINITY_DN8532_c0_g1_i1.p1 TRINITY_DN8532_c0_g1~~TRINITY_DN8532_c0_g1_i1.p1  ORF type:complete len:532 (-),score=134.82 TRINITY_DN8532_c0_g1_i1:66-1661(-)
MGFQWPGEGQYYFTSQIDELFKKEFTLQDVLDNEDVVMEVRNAKKTLIDYLGTKEIVVELIDYIIDPKPDATELEKLKFPVVSSEILSSEIEQIDKIWFENEDLLDRMWNYFDSENYDPLRGNLVLRVFIGILSSMLDESLEYLKKHDAYIPIILNNITNGMVSEYITTLISMEDRKAGVIDWLNSLKLIERIIALFDIKHEEIHMDVAALMIDIMEASGWESSLILTLSDTDCCTTLLDYFIGKENGSKSALRYGLDIFVFMISLTANNDQQMRYEDDQYDDIRPVVDPDTELEKLPPQVLLVMKNIQKFVDILKEEPAKHPLQQHQRVLGIYRLKVLELFDSLMTLEYNAVMDELLNCGAFTIFLDLFLGIERNNFCHRLVEEIFYNFLETGSIARIVSLLKQSELVEKLIEGTKNNTDSENGGTFRNQYMPYLVNIGQHIQSLANEPLVREVLSTIPEWPDFEAFIIQEVEASNESDELDSYESPTTSSSSDYANDFEFDNDDKDYDISEAEVLLSKCEIEEIKAIPV